MPYIDEGNPCITANDITAGTLTVNNMSCINIIDKLVLDVPNPEETTVMCNGYKYKLVRDDCSEED